nr:bifunctional folylpolyglutamate synthase/dihydrofolate synthase [Bacilli bacterium]
MMMNTIDSMKAVRDDGVFQPGIVPGLSRMQELLALLGSPEQKLPIVHVAGTNGKGSTCMMLASILQAAKYRVGRYLSDAVVSIAVNDVPIEEKAYQAYQEKIATLALSMQDRPTQFESKTAIAFQYFADQSVDLVILETGMGGLLDATNVVHPILSIVTNVTEDHQDWLGDTLAEIARHKAGILKPQVPCVTAAKGEALAVLTQVALQKNCALKVFAEHFRIVKERSSRIDQGQRVSYFGLRNDLLGLDVALLGEHQLENVAVTLAGIECLCERGYGIDAAAIRHGLQCVRFPYRLDVLAKNPLILADGAHNKASAASLALSLRQVHIHRYILILAIMRDKAVVDVVNALAVPASLVIVTTIEDNERALSTQTLHEIVAQRCLNHEVAQAKDRVQALSYALERFAQNPEAYDAILLAGSFYLLQGIEALLG